MSRLPMYDQFVLDPLRMPMPPLPDSEKRKPDREPLGWSHGLVRRRSLVVSASLLALGHPMAARADEAAALVQKVYDRPSGRDLTTLARMELTEQGRPPRTRVVVTYRQQREGRERVTLIRFLQPADISGVGLLSVSKADGSTDQSLFLPELDRVRKVASDRRGGRFVGSDLYFEDLQDRDAERDRHRLLRTEALGGVPCDVIESLPVDAEDSVYVKRQSWIDRETLLPLRVDYFERADAPANKRWTVGARARVQGYWTIMDSTMTDLKQGSQTRLVLDKAIYDRKLPTRLFTSRALADEGYEAEFRP